MAQAPIIPPTPANTSHPWLQTRDGIAEASSGAFAANQFVTVAGTPSTLIATTTGAITVYGLEQRAAAGTGAEPYTAPTGTTHFPINPDGVTFWVNTMDSNRAVGTGSAAGLIVGSSYGLASFTTSGYTNIQGLNTSVTTSTQAMFRVEQVGGYGDTTTADTNCPVRVSILPANIL